MYHKLSGRGAKRDSPQCREVMHGIMSKYHPSLWNSYVAGKVKDVPRFENDHITHYKQRKRQPKKDAAADIIDTGGSLNPIQFSEDGYLMTHNSEFHYIREVV